jgi:hypothetical protein
MTRDLGKMFGVFSTPNAAPFRDRMAWSPDDQRQFLDAIPILARAHGVLPLPDGNIVRADDVGTIAVRPLRDGRWGIVIARENGAITGQLIYGDASMAAETAAVLITCWAEVARRSAKKGAQS